MTNLSGANLNNGAAVGPHGEGMDSLRNFPTYPEYKDSGVEWLGEVPEHWAVYPLKRAIERIESGTSVNAADFPAEPGSLGVLKTSCVYTGKFDWTENKTVDDEDLSRVSCPLRKDTLIVSRMNTPDLVGATGLVTEAPNGIFLPDRLWQVYFLVNHSPEFLFYFSKSREYREQVKMACSGTSASMQNLGQDDFRGLLFAEPPKPEQTQIARFLDHETARIDALIEEQQRLIELLKEKRQAVIAHAVTKGLDPTVPMKDSGVEWLGEVPAHWVVAGLKWFWSVTDCKHITAEFVDDGVPLASIREVQCRYVSLENAKQTTEFFYRQLIEAGRKPVAGDLIFSRNATVGEVAQVADWHPPFAMGQDVCLLKKQFEWLSSDYLQAVLRSPVVAVQLDNLMIGSTFKRVNVEDIRGLVVPMPPEKEQQLIADYLNSETGQFDSLLAECQGTIGLLQERRSALISAAVTGKIDVRGWQPPASTQAPESAVAEAV